MKIKFDKFSFEFTTKDLEWFQKLSKADQLKFIALFAGAVYYVNKEAMKWYLTIKEENRKDKIQNNELKVAAKKLEIKNNSNN